MGLKTKIALGAIVVVAGLKELKVLEKQVMHHDP